MQRALGTAALGALLVLFGGMFDAEPLYVPGVALMLLAGASAAWTLAAAQGVTVRRRLETHRVVEGEPLNARLEATRGGMPLPPGSAIVDPLVPDPMPLDGAARRAGIRIVVRFGRRGPRSLPPARVLVRDPLELACRERSAAERDEILVLPRLHPVEAEPGAGSGRLGRAAPLLAAAAMEVDGIRPYREGTPAARIHWPALARGAGLMERRLRAEGDALPLVVLDPRAAARTEDEDAAVRAAASLAHSLATGSGGCAVLLPGDRRATVLDADLGAWPALHARFALVDGARSPALTLAAAGSRRGAVIFVSARVIDRYPAGAITIARGSRMLVVPGALPGRRPAFTVAGCRGYTLGERTRRARPEAGAAAAGGVA